MACSLGAGGSISDSMYLSMPTNATMAKSSNFPVMHHTNLAPMDRPALSVPDPAPRTLNVDPPTFPRHMSFDMPDQEC
jgi:hypothetical protein